MSRILLERGETITAEARRFCKRCWKATPQQTVRAERSGNVWYFYHCTTCDHDEAP